MEEFNSGCTGDGEFSAYHAKVEVSEGFVHVKRTWVARFGGIADAVIYLNDVREVIARKPSRALSGYVYLRTANDPKMIKPQPPVWEYPGGNSRVIVFTHQQQDDQLELLAALRQKLHGVPENWA